MTAYLDLADYLLIAEAVLGVPAELIADFNPIGLADSALAAPRAGLMGIPVALCAAATSRATASSSLRSSPMPAHLVDPGVDEERQHEAVEGPP